MTTVTPERQGRDYLHEDSAVEHPAPLRVLLVAASFGAFGGMEAVMLQIARELASGDGIEPTLCFKRVKGTDFKPSLVDSVAASGARAIYVDRLSGPLFRAIAASDVVNVHNPSLDVALAARALRKPLVMTIHRWRCPRSAIRQRALDLANRVATVRTYNSDFVWSTWEPGQRRPDSLKLPVLPELPSGQVPSGDRKGFLFVARLIENKGPEVLIEAYRRADIDHARWPLTIVGEGPLRASLEEKVRTERIEGIAFRGFVDGETKHDLIRHAKWMVTPPHHKEDLGLTPLEARHVAVPCIVTRDGGLLEAAGNFCLSCEPRNVEQLTALLEHAARMPEAYYKILAQASHEELLDYLKPMSLYADLYRSVAGRAT